MSLIAQLLPVVIVVFVIWLFAIHPFRRREKALNQMLDYEKRMEDLKREIVVVTTDSVPGKRVIKTLGPVRGVSSAATTQEEFKKAETEALYKMIKEAKKLGANAVVGLKVGTGTYQHQGSSWQVSHIMYTGTAVLVE